MDNDNIRQGYNAEDRRGYLGGQLCKLRSGPKWIGKLRILTLPFILAVLVVMPAWDVMGQVAPTLGTVESFAVLGGSTVTNTGPTVVNGDVGVSPGSAVTGFPPGIVVAPGVIHAGDAVAAQAQSDVTIAYDALAGQACDVNLTGQDLGGLTLTSGVYCFDTSAQLTGQLTLDVEGNPDAVFIFKVGSTLTTASGASVVFSNGGPSCNVFWQVGSSATFGTNSAFAGDVIALTSITLNTDADVTGRVLARNGAVTLDTNVISRCIAAPTSTPTNTPTGTPPTPTNTPTGTPTPTATAPSTPTPTATTTPPATAVEILYFWVSRDGQTVVLNWATAQEVDNYGFTLHRAPVDDFALAEFVHFEPSAIQGGTGSGATYDYVDTPPVAGRWWYWLVDIDTQGIQTLHNPSVVIAMQVQFHLYLPWIGRHQP
jgi:hypothetical protein